MTLAWLLGGCFFRDSTEWSAQATVIGSHLNPGAGPSSGTAPTRCIDVEVHASPSFRVAKIDCSPFQFTPVGATVEVLYVLEDPQGSARLGSRPLWPYVKGFAAFGLIMAALVLIGRKMG